MILYNKIEEILVKIKDEMSYNRGPPTRYVDTHIMYGDGVLYPHHSLTGGVFWLPSFDKKGPPARNEGESNPGSDNSKK